MQERILLLLHNSVTAVSTYKKALKKNPQAVEKWEDQGQAKVSVKVNSEEEL